MSKIAIKGAETGTGVFTLESPATNTDRTLVLPDEAGTVLTSASGVAKTGGTITGPFTVLNGYDETKFVRNVDVTSVGPAAHRVSIGALYSGNQVTPVQIEGGVDTDGTALWTKVLHDGGSVLTIDSAGRVTMPYQPVFDVSYSGGSYGLQNPVLFDAVDVNVGNYYSTSTGRFTAPIDGAYYFYTTHIKNNSTLISRRRFNKNGVAVNARHLRLDADQAYGDNGVLAQIIFCNAGDYITVEQFAGNSYGSSSYDYFGGYLIG